MPRLHRQLRLELQQPASLRREDFIVSPANAEAVRVVESWPAWHGGAIALVGPAASGKTHLAHSWAKLAGAIELAASSRVGDLDGLQGRPILMEGAEAADAETLFHLINMAALPGGGLLLTSRTAPAGWDCALPDLRSRLNALMVAEVGPPDDEMLRGVLQKFFRERNIRAPEDVFAYLVRRMERSVPVALALVERLDEASGADHRPVSRALAREILEDGDETEDLFEPRLADGWPSGDKGG